MNKRVLVATDNDFLGSFLQKRLALEEFDTDRVGSDAELQVCMEKKRYDLVLAHVDIPHACEVCAGRKSRDREDVPFVLMSGREQDREPALQARADAFLKIPFNETEFIELLDRLLRRKTCILLVDDSRVIHQRTGKFLRGQGFHVIDAMDGQEGLEMTRREKPDLVITDVEMPRMDGYRMCQALKSNENTALLPVIIVSSLSKGIDIDKGFVAGANDYLIKPVVHAELLSCVNSILHTMKIRRQETVLVVEDNMNVQNMLKFGLMQQGFHVVICTDGEEAYEKALASPPDVIVADMDTPNLDGRHFVRYLKERDETRNVPVIILSNRESRSELARGLHIGTSAFITKPFSIDKVVLYVERLTVERRFRRERQAVKLYLSEAALEAVEKSAHNKDQFGRYQAMEKPLTILFCDMVGFTQMCEQLQPTEAVALLNRYMDAMTTLLIEHGAVIDKYIGDAILAVFGEDPSGIRPELRAVTAAMALIAKQKEIPGADGNPVKSRIGINTGRVIFGDIGSKFYRRDFTVIGDPVNTAQRLQAAAEPDTVFISDPVYQSVKDLVEVEDTGSLSLKGKVKKIQTYKVLSVQDKEG